MISPALMGTRTGLIGDVGIVIAVLLHHDRRSM